MTTRWDIRRWRGSPEQDRYLRMLGSEVGAVIRPADKVGGSRVARTNRTFNQFEIDPRTKRPRVYIHENCPNLKMGIQSYSEIPEGVALQGVARPSDDAIRRDDDEVDALGYLLEEVATVHQLTDATELVVAQDSSPMVAGSIIMAKRREMRHNRLERLLKQWGEL